MKVLFATSNPAKVKRYKELLKDNGIELITLNDIDIDLDVEESGKNALENAHIKAKAYFDKLNIPTIGMDNSLFIEDINEDEQPGTHVRRVGGKTITDDEMIEHYTSLVKKYGDKLVAKWVYGMVIYTEKGIFEYTWNKDDFYFVSKPCSLRNPGYPLDSIAVVPEYNKYLVELTEADKQKTERTTATEKVIEFIVNSVKK